MTHEMACGNHLLTHGLTLGRHKPMSVPDSSPSLFKGCLIASKSQGGRTWMHPRTMGCPIGG